MKPFKDSQGRDWEITVNVGTLKRVKAIMEADILDIGPTFERLMVDPIFLVDVLWGLCKPQAESKHGITEEDFGAAFSGDAISRARTALAMEIRDFFPSPEERSAAQAAMIKAKSLRDLLREKMSEAIRETDETDLVTKVMAAAKREMEKELQQILGDSSTGSPESPVSTPAPSRSGNSTG